MFKINSDVGFSEEDQAEGVFGPAGEEVESSGHEAGRSSDEATQNKTHRPLADQGWHVFI